MKNGYVIKISVDGELSAEKVDQDNLLHDLQALVGGNIEVVTLSKFNALVLDEEGKLKNKSYNLAATKYLRSLCPDRRDDYIVGDAVVVKLVPDDFTAYDLLNYVRSTALPKVRAIING